ncbi:MAG: Flp pilus assembly complex ATPase component TadA [Planctomycetes bacterium]|nr:Flp pilus assembly complex ATPase component TadA [Planctomycetota bacterium]
MSQSGRLKLGDLLLQEGVIDTVAVDQALRYQYEHKVRFGEALVALGLADEVCVARALARQADLPFVDLSKGKIRPEVLATIDRAVAEEYRMLPIKISGGVVFVAIADPVDALNADSLSFLLGREVRCALAAPSALRAAFKTHYDLEAGPARPGSPARAAAAALAAPPEVDEDEAPIIRLVTQLAENALKMRASDIHVESFEQRLRVRYRVDGVCREVASYPKHLQGPVLSRLKIMSGMDIAEKRQPQDGRINLKIDGRDIDVRVSALPSTHGESIVLRLLDKETGLVSLERLGFHPDDMKRFHRIIQRPNGIFLVTGPTGSGKTTTLYAGLKELNRPDVKIITAENPVEYHLPGVNQAEVQTRVGMTFARILRAMLRQAPNIILVGEIRDRETAEIAIQAALTGHLVFSTLHTNDAPSAITRLIDMGVKPFLVSSSVQAVMAQRLVRRLCPECKAPYHPPASELKAVGLAAEDVPDVTLYRAVGCAACEQTGYRGRQGIFELLEMNSEMRNLIHRMASTSRLREAAVLAGGMVTLLRDGVRKALAGSTSLDEVLRVTYGEEMLV